jgi:holo-[acyl-carrier protein] synthase
MGLVGIGVDVVDVDRFSLAVVRTPGFVARVLTEDERTGSPQSLAARFAAKEALAKALGAPVGLRWHDAVVRGQPSGQPRFDVTGTAAQACRDRGAATIHLTLSHDGGMAVAMVVLEST